jgi:hypothetical protein
VTATRIEKLSGDVTRLTLSPGERAGVRASVNSYSTENSEEPNFLTALPVLPKLLSEGRSQTPL